jgi:outer membrane protein assembly factor BamB
MRLSLSLLVFVALSVSGLLFAEDVFRFRGENSQGKYNEPELLDSWPEEGLTPKWVNSDLGEGWSSVSKVKDRLYLTCLDSNDAKRETVVCLDLNGKQLWQQPVGVIWRNGSYPFPRATPTYAVGEKPGDDRLLVLSGNGELYCIAATDGKYLWHQEIAGTYQTQFGLWGTAESVLVHDGKVFVTACGKKALAVAFHIADGSLAWESEPIDDLLAYIAPVLCENYLVFLTDRYVTLLHAETGQLFWKGDYWEDTGGKAIPSPAFCNSALVKGNRFLVAQGYNQGAVMYEILPDGRGVNKLWSSKVLGPHHGGMVEIDGRIYGSNWTNNTAGNWCCLDWETGKTIYDEPWGNLGKGVTIYADGKLFLYEEKRGTLALALPGDHFNVVSSFRFDFGTKEHWPHPVISDGVMYVRRGNTLAAFDIRK